MTIEVNKIYAENCLDTMARMPDGFVNCVITSPPYYGLRSYQTEPQIWDADVACQHVWGTIQPFTKHDPRTAEKKREQGSTVGGSITFNAATTLGDSGTFCQRCNAWRGELGLEPSFHLYIAHLLQVFAEVKRVLKPNGTIFVNLGDSYNGTKIGNTEIHKNPNVARTSTHRKQLQASLRPKSLMNIPHRVFIGMTDELQLIQRNNINWWKRACMPSSATDRWTVDFESIGFFTKSPNYTFNQDIEPYTKPLDRWGGENLIATQTEGWHTGTGQPIYRNRNMRPNPEGRNARTTWDIGYEPSNDEHYASYPTRLVEKMMRAGSNAGDLIYDPFGGTATTAVTAHQLGRQWICSELQGKYVEISNKRLEPYLAQESLF